MENPETQKPKVLYVDDAKDYVFLFANLLNRDFKIYTAQSGEEGLEILKRENIQVVVSDQRMPGMSGEELLEKVAVEYPDIIRFMISGFSDHEAIVYGVNKGQIQGYFHKPIEPEEIRVSINKGIEMANLKKKNKEILEELETANTALINTDRNKNVFLQILSKELSTPLNELRATVQVFKNKSISEDLNKLVNLLDQNVTKFELLSSLANQITLLKINDRKLNLESTTTEKVMEYLFIEISEKLNKRNIQLVLPDKNQNLQFKGEFNLIISCLENIIDNALDHTPDEGKIMISTGEENGMVFFEVVDQCMNYSEEYVKSIRYFFSTDKELLNANLNLGLVLAKQIIDVHKGRIEYHSSEKKGSLRVLFHSFKN